MDNRIKSAINELNTYFNVEQWLIDEQIRRWKYNKKVWEDFNDENSYEFKYGDLFVPLNIKERYLPMVIPNKETLDGK